MTTMYHLELPKQPKTQGVVFLLFVTHPYIKLLCMAVSVTIDWLINLMFCRLIILDFAIDSIREKVAEKN